MNNYWDVCIEEALGEIGINATPEQLKELVEWVEGGHENYGLATGVEVADSSFISDEARELEALKADQEKVRIWKASTDPCPSCITTGTVKGYWGKDVNCGSCGGEGRIRQYN